MEERSSSVEEKEFKCGRKKFKCGSQGVQVWKKGVQVWKSRSSCVEERSSSVEVKEFKCGRKEFKCGRTMLIIFLGEGIATTKWKQQRKCIPKHGIDRILNRRLNLIALLCV